MSFNLEDAYRMQKAQKECIETYKNMINAYRLESKDTQELEALLKTYQELLMDTEKRIHNLLAERALEERDYDDA